jgi:PAS domain S-box-containing protein
MVGSDTDAHDLESAFGARGYHVHTVHTGVEGSELFKKHLPDITILDSQLQDITNEQFLKSLKQPGVSTVTVLLINGHDAKETLQLMSKGADGYIRRPFDPEHLVNLCEKIHREQSLVRVEKLLEERTEKLRTSERKYRSLLGYVPEIVIVHDTDGIILHINDVGAERLGWAVSDLVGKSLSEIILPDCAAQVSGHVEQTVGKGSCNFETTYTSSASQLIEAEVNERPIEFEGKQAILSVGRDITKRKQAESERVLLSTAVEQATDIIIITDTEGKIQYVNPAFERITGYTSAEVLGKNPSILKSCKHNEDFYRTMWETIKRGEVWTGHIVNKKKNGTLFEEDATVTPIRNAQGDVASYVAVKRDVTLEVAMEEQLRQSRKLEELGSLAGGVAHDFNNLLTGILGYVSILKANARKEDDVFRAAAVIEKAATRAAQLTEQLLGFARRGKHRNIPVDLHKSIQAVVNLLSGTIEKNIAITQDMRADSPLILGDPGQIEQVILNLAVNARDAMPEGGKLVFTTDVVELDELYCRIHTDATPGRYVMVSIDDTGYGIGKDVMERIFEPFFTTKEQGKGTGMGLAMVYGIVKNHGGSIQVYSEPGYGAAFKFYLPLASTPTAAEAESRQDEPISGIGRILVVDDEEIVRQTATELLSHLGYDVNTVSDGRKAVEYYKEFGDRIDLVVLDMVMPRMGGRDCFRTLKEINPHVKAVLSTGYSLDSTMHEILDEGIIAFAQKPYQMKKLAEVVAFAIKK